MYKTLDKFAFRDYPRLRGIKMDNYLSGKTIVVTGATSGIGLALAELLAQGGARVIGVGRSAERCAQSEQHLRSLANGSGATADYLLADLSSLREVRQLARQIREHLARQGKTALDALVN